MFLLAHSLHLTGPVAILLTVGMIALRMAMRRSRRSRIRDSRIRGARGRRD